MNEFNSKLVEKSRLLPGIHGLRGVAALAVVLFHLIHVGGIQTPSEFGFIGRYFGNSVHLFFIVSAYSLMYSTESKTNQPNWLVNYFIKRFFRIAPLFYAVIVFYIWFGLYRVSGMSGFTNLILNLTFTFGFAPPLWVCMGWLVGGG